MAWSAETLGLEILGLFDEAQQWLLDDAEHGLVVRHETKKANERAYYASSADRRKAVTEKAYRWQRENPEAFRDIQVRYRERRREKLLKDHVTAQRLRDEARVRSASRRAKLRLDPALWAEFKERQRAQQAASKARRT